MRLIHVTTILDFETSINQGRGIDRSTEILREFYGPALAAKEYAILSHCWGVAENGEKEVSFQEMEQLATTYNKTRNEIRGRTGYKKVIDACKQAKVDGLEWVWVDTCCIDKKSSSELSEAVNSMCQWYANANQCYVYLHDSTGSIRSSAKWFTRGWTLQELIAPKVVHFFDSKWERLGNKEQFASNLSRITRIPENILKHGLNSERPSIAQIMSWAADRVTTREEDRAYSLLGLLGVHIPMLYGEGKNAFRRLQLEIIRSSNDQSIFAWGQTKDAGWSNSFLADDPSYFRDCSDVISLSPDEFTRFLTKYRHIPEDELSQIPAERLRTFTVTNDGIQIWLPTVTLGPYAEVQLACQKSSRNALTNCTTMNLAFFESGCFRFFGGKIPNSGPMEFKPHFLPYKDVTQNSSSFTFELDCQSLAVHGFVGHSVEPKSVQAKGDSVTLSKDNDFATVTYVHKRHKTCLAVVPIYFRGRGRVFIISSRNSSWIPYLRLHVLKAFLKIWKDEGCHVGHAHAPRSIRHVRAIYTERSRLGCKVTIEVVRCPGCCPSRMESEAPQLPSVPMKPTSLYSVNVCSELMADLWNIRFKFSELVGWVPYVVGTVEAATKYFMDMFGVSNFHNFIGEITFFKELTLIMGSDVSGRLCTGEDRKEDEQVTEVAQEQRINASVKYLVQIKDSWLDIEPRFSHPTRAKLWEEAMKWRLEPVAAKLLRVIGTAYEPSDSHSTQGLKFSKQELLSNLQEIKKLQETLAEIDDDNGNNNNNNAKRRALVEDVAGRILLTFWRGISSEVSHMLDKVADRFLNDEAITMTPDLVQSRRHRLFNIGRILLQVASSNSDDGLDPLQRMMDDAADGVSKYQLILAELARRSEKTNATKNVLNGRS